MVENQFDSPEKELLFKNACRKIIEKLLSIINKDKFFDYKKLNINNIKLEILRDYANIPVPKNSEILFYAEPNEYDLLLPILRIKRVRTISGVVVVAIMSDPYKCPHGKCLYCPGGPEFNVPQSYTGYEPATRRGIQNKFDPYEQVYKRLDQLRSIGHNVSKIELIIMGGTFPARDQAYQEFFIKQALASIADFGSKQTKRASEESLEDVINRCETSPNRLIGFTLETRPDYCTQNQINFMLNCGVTRVELGVQTVYEEIYKIVGRGHTINDVIKATQLLKDSGFKVLYHLMPNLPGSTPDMDLNTFLTIYNDPNFKPDMLKVYPCLVIKGTKLYEMWKSGTYKSYPLEKTVSILADAFSKIPKWMRIQRVQRDIPVQLIEDGVKKSNLHELISEELAKHGLKCQCIRCREVGHIGLKKNIQPNPENIKITKTVYEASKGTEIFIACEDVIQDILIGYLRLRIPSEHAFRPEITEKPSCIVRALRVYGTVVPLGSPNLNSQFSWQHKKIGADLLKTAENIAINDYDLKKILVISGIGVREYYYKQGYKKDGPYVSKYLD